MLKMKNKYRIVNDDYCGYECQVKYWFFPFVWFQLEISNTHSSIEKAKKFINEKRRKKHTFVLDVTDEE